MYVTSFYQVDINYSHLGLGDVCIRLVCWHVCGTFSRLMINVGGPSPVWAVPALGRWSCLV